MHARAKFTAGMLPLAALLAACNPSPYSAPVTNNPPPPPPPVAGAFGAPVTTAPPLSGSTTPPTVASPSAPMRLSASEIQSLLANNTAVGTNATGIPYAVYFSPDGRARFHEAGLYDTGTWRVMPDGRLCSRLPTVNANSEQCYILSQSGDTTLFQPPGGGAVGSFRVVAGDPQNL
jgi:hypothetical protein